MLDGLGTLVWVWLTGGPRWMGLDTGALAWMARRQFGRPVIGQRVVQPGMRQLRRCSISSGWQRSGLGTTPCQVGMPWCRNLRPPALQLRTTLTA